jgi:hypothetical protein
LPGGVETSEPFGGELGPILRGAEQGFDEGVVVADTWMEYDGLMPSQ